MPTVEPLILSACRTPIGRYLGGLASLSAVELGVVAASGAIERAGVRPGDLEEAIVGNVLSAGLGQAPARQVALGSGMDPGSSALTINMVCGSGLRSVMLAATAIKAGEAELILAGGMESMSNAPHLLKGGRGGWRIGDRELVDALMHDGLTCAVEGWPMGNAAERTAGQGKLTRGELDAQAVESHRRAIEARESGAFAAEIVAVNVKGKKGESSTVVEDEGPRGETSFESLGKLAPAFQAEGMVTAGNSSMLSDGAAMLVVASDERASRMGSRPLARIVATGVSGREPRDVFLAPIGAIRQALGKAGLSPGEIDLYEINEAFAAQLIGCIRGLGLDPMKVNVHGGAIALGHPIGASGARVLVTLLHALERRGGRFGVASLCLGGGNAVAMVVERIARPGP